MSTFQVLARALLQLVWINFQIDCSVTKFRAFLKSGLTLSVTDDSQREPDFVFLKQNPASQRRQPILARVIFTKDHCVVHPSLQHLTAKPRVLNITQFWAKQYHKLESCICGAHVVVCQVGSQAVWLSGFYKELNTKVLSSGRAWERQRNQRILEEEERKHRTNTLDKHANMKITASATDVAMDGGGVTGPCLIICACVLSELMTAVRGGKIDKQLTAQRGVTVRQTGKQDGIQRVDSEAPLPWSCCFLGKSRHKIIGLI